MSEQQFWIHFDQGISGPFSFTQLQQLAQTGKVTPETGVSPNRRAWVPAKMFRNLAFSQDAETKSQAEPAPGRGGSSATQPSSNESEDIYALAEPTSEVETDTPNYKASANDSDSASHEGSTTAAEACPMCGFKYGWDGKFCKHCKRTVSDDLAQPVPSGTPDAEERDLCCRCGSRVPESTLVGTAFYIGVREYSTYEKTSTVYTKTGEVTRKVCVQCVRRERQIACIIASVTAIALLVLAGWIAWYLEPAWVFHPLWVLQPTFVWIVVVPLVVVSAICMIVIGVLLSNRHYADVVVKKAVQRKFLGLGGSVRTPAQWERLRSWCVASSDYDPTDLS